jgi:ATP phosphoribosyltransferase regulatory subunit HisZ
MYDEAPELTLVRRRRDMHRFSLEHLTDGALLNGLKANAARKQGSLANMLAHITEIEVRKLHLAAGHSSIRAYCVDELHLSSDAVDELIQAQQEKRAGESVLEIPMTKATYAKLLRVRELLGEQGPVPDDATILKMALEVLLQRRPAGTSRHGV